MKINTRCQIIFIFSFIVRQTTHWLSSMIVLNIVRLGLDLQSVLDLMVRNCNNNTVVVKRKTLIMTVS